MNKIMILIPGVLLFATISCNNKSGENTQETTGKNTTENNDQSRAAVTSPGLPPDMQSLIGEWRLVSWIPDKNGNSKLDPEEEKQGKLDQPDYLKLNPDGTCEYTDVKIQARFAI